MSFSIWWWVHHPNLGLLLHMAFSLALCTPLLLSLIRTLVGGFGLYWDHP